MKQVAILVVGAAMVAQVHASFDMMLMPGSDGRTYRYDPSNNVLLGSFITTTQNLAAVDRNNGRAFFSAVTGSAIRSHDYSTGELRGIYGGSTLGRGLEYSSDYVYLLTPTNLRRTNLTSGVATTITLGSANWMSTAINGNYLHCIGINASNQIVYQIIDTSTFTAASMVTTSTTVLAGSVLGKAAFTSNPGTGIASMMFTTITGAGTFSFAYANAVTAGYITQTSFSTSAISGFVSTSFMPAVLPGHVGWWMVGQDSTDNTKSRITRYDYFTGPIFNSSSTMATPGGTYNVFGGYYSPANVVAPEPGSLTVVAIGIGAILRRRRASKS